ncbi:probable UDP-glucosyl transferase 73B6 [Arachis stenosperma]|uniref:probable UDP-glucosyl transferase 73B6 n=1 Tax=Arachis stenosperma TaxID=217475 RepID=UPI0025AC2F6E|nr:probable UDP-glucosyl transferase 73B6 [Arachis stenosperma]
MERNTTPNLAVKTKVNPVTEAYRRMPISRPLKIYFLPFFAQGHLIPLVHLARLVASRGQHVTILTTPSNAQLLDKIIDEETAAGHHIRVHIFKFPSDRLGIPAGIENLFAVSDSVTASKIYMAAHLIKPAVDSFISESPPDVFIPDIMFTWSVASAKQFNLPRVVFNPISIFDVCMIEAIKAHPEVFESNSGPYEIPGLPHSLTIPIKPSPGFARVTEPLVEAEKDSLGVIANSFRELDAEYTEHYENHTGRKVWPIGPTSLMVQKTATSSVSEEEHECLKWLSTKENGSVVYICFGSMCLLSDEQLYQLALGLESSGHQFLWVVHRKKTNDDEGEGDEKWLPHGFEERMKKEDRGMVLKGWAPQPLILNHAAVGGFVTHCGWNATVEAISAGVPMITMPAFADQYYNEKLITQVHGFGVEVGAAEWSISPFEPKTKVVGAERIEKAVKKLMDGGDEAERIKSKAKEMKEKAWNAVQKGGSSYNSLTELIDQLQKLVLAAPAAISSHLDL